ncbi:hypothetical protein IEQ34_011929 [Dendrobium chrysotoxum]|uniref:Uncharacterized protein n=1 Tax=Dendrobium chrysotoxum TaxID=161865 RepID=A0AAV7GSN4_DENCH|nr:hypothetical protein IEQ34_011929 [Dendrobium chrysotoxum]
MEQSLSTSMLAIVQSTMKALIVKDLLGHLKMDVKVSITSFLSEITRITEPDAPYDDEIMKDIFGQIVGAFKNLIGLDVKPLISEESFNT